VTQDVRKRAVYLRFLLTFNPSAVTIPPDLGIDETRFPKATTRQVFVEVLRENDAMDSDITFEMVTDQTKHKDILTVYANKNAPFTFMAAASDRDVPDSDTYDTWFKDAFSKVKFEALKQAGRTYIGRMERLKSLGGISLPNIHGPPSRSRPKRPTERFD